MFHQPAWLCLRFASWGTTQRNATFFGGCAPWWGAITRKFELGQDFCTVHLPSKFHHPMFTRSGVTVLTNKHTNPQTNRRHWKHPSLFDTLRCWVILSHREHFITDLLTVIFHCKCPILVFTFSYLYLQYVIRFYMHCIVFWRHLILLSQDWNTVSLTYLLLCRYFTCAPMYGLFTPVQKLSSPESAVAPDVKSSLPNRAPSPRSSGGHRQRDNTVCLVNVIIIVIFCHRPHICINVTTLQTFV